MIKIEAGQNDYANRVRSGESGKGGWELISVSDKGGKQRVTVFVANRPSGVREGGMFRVEKITNMKFGFKKDSYGQWKPDVSIEAEVSPIASEYDEVSGMQAPWSEELPKDPWADIQDFPE